RALFADPPPPPDGWHIGRLRKALVVFQADPDDTSARHSLVTCLLEDIAGLRGSCGGAWLRGSAVPAEFTHRSVTGEIVKPQHLWQHEGSPCLPVFLTRDPRLGVGKGRRSVA